MRNVWIGVLMMAFCGVALAGQAGFAAKPKAVKEGDKVRISFAVSSPTDVEVSIVDGQPAQGGRVVRHLAAGVLGGANPPPAPLKSGLAQELVWDGKDDLGLAHLSDQAKAPLHVRVRAGMTVAFGRTIGDSPYILNGTYCRGLAVDANGDHYVLGQKSRDGVMFFLRVYDRTGKYLRELMPYPAKLSPA